MDFKTVTSKLLSAFEREHINYAPELFGNTETAAELRNKYDA